MIVMIAELFFFLSDRSDHGERSDHTWKPGLRSLVSGADLGGGCRGCAPPPRDDLRFSNTTGILPKKTIWFIGAEVEQEMSAPPPRKNPGSAPGQ